MTNNYLNIPYDKAKTFLEGLPEDKLECVFDQYNISESLDFTKIAQLAEYISDADLIGLGYIEEVTPSPSSCVSFSCGIFPWQRHSHSRCRPEICLQFPSFFPHDTHKGTMKTSQVPLLTGHLQ